MNTQVSEIEMENRIPDWMLSYTKRIERNRRRAVVKGVVNRDQYDIRSGWEWYLVATAVLFAAFVFLITGGVR